MTASVETAVRDDSLFRGTHSEEILVDVKDLRMYFPVTEGAIISRVVAEVKAVDGVSFNIR